MDGFMDFFNKPSVAETFVDILLCAVPIWVAVMSGLLIGWSWRPRWTRLIFLGFRSKLQFLWTAPLGFGAHRVWLAFTVLSATRSYKVTIHPKRSFFRLWYSLVKVRYYEHQESVVGGSAQVEEV